MSLKTMVQVQNKRKTKTKKILNDTPQPTQYLL